MFTILKRKLRSANRAAKAILKGEPREVREAALRGWTQLPPDAKRASLLQHAQKFGLTTFIETGTYHGETLAYLLSHFDDRYSIELSPEFHAAAQKKFQHAPKVHLVQGDSSTCLPEVLKRTSSNKTLIWLDAHYSGKETAQADCDTPIVEELNLVFATLNFRPFILIDDAREFGSDPAYPSLKYVEDLARKNGYNFECYFDIIRLIPQGK